MRFGSGVLPHSQEKGGREGPNVDESTLTHDRLGERVRATMLARTPWRDCSQLHTFFKEKRGIVGVKILGRRRVPGFS